MTKHQAREVLSWRYPPPYDFYNGSEDGLAEMLDGSYYAVTGDDGTLAGFFGFGETSTVPGGHALGLYTPDALDIGLGMRPELTGKGMGLAFTTAGMEFAFAVLGASWLRLSVATFNRRAIAVYERAGFRPIRRFMSATSGGREMEFLLMVTDN